MDDTNGKYTHEQKVFFGEMLKNYSEEWKKSEDGPRRTRDEFCKMIAISKSSFHNYVKGNVPDAEIDEICRVLGVDKGEWTEITPPCQIDIMKSRINGINRFTMWFNLAILIASFICMIIVSIKKGFDDVMIPMALCFTIALANLLNVKRYDSLGKEIVPSESEANRNKAATVICLILIGLVFITYIILLFR